MGITRDYFAMQKYFEEKYGEMTICLVMIGKFYEVYEHDPNQNDQQIEVGDKAANISLKMSLKQSNSRTSMPGEVSIDSHVPVTRSIGHAVDVSLLLNMQLTSKNKEKPHSMDNPFMVGFPTPVYENHRDLLLMNGYTIVRIDQKIRTAEGENVEREVVEISSSSTEIEHTLTIQPTGTNSIVSLFIECQKAKGVSENNVVVSGMSCLDVTTGQSLVCEVYSKERDEVYAIQEIYRFLAAHRPVELILHVTKLPEDQSGAYLKYLNKILELEKYPTQVVRCNQLDPNFQKLEYQDQFLRKVFPTKVPEGTLVQNGTKGPRSIIEDLNLEKFHYGRISYLILLQHCYEHNEALLRKLHRPQVNWTDEKTHLILTDNALNQLDIFPRQIEKRKKGIYDCLLSVVDLTSTSLGSRYLRRNLLNPITDVERLELYYAMTDELFHDTKLLNTIESILKKIPDIERLHRKVQMGVIKPREFVSLFRTYQSIRELYVLLYQVCFPATGEAKQALKGLFMAKADVDDFNDCLTEIWTIINFDKLDRVKFTSNIGGKAQKLQCDDSFINQGHDSELDQIQTSLQQYQNWLHTICEHLNSLLESTRGKKIEPTFERAKTTTAENEEDTEGSSELTIGLYTTPHKAKVIKGSQVNHQLCGTLEFHQVKSKTMISSEIINPCCRSIESMQTTLEQKLLAKFFEIVAKVATRTYFSGLNTFIATLDFIKSNAQCALKYKYYRPSIDKSASKSFVRVSGLRHPLIERIITTEYIPNDVELNGNGLLLFGINSTGKSSLAKALALSVIMAQSGMFVPGSLHFYPYSKIITRLSGNDDILKGQSSYIVEMSELRTILRNADSNTLVVGDELCRGTETVSGTSLTVATIQTLTERKTSFIFSTHMHHLPSLKTVKGLVESKKLRIAHLTALHDDKSNRLIYHRILEEGPGSSLYGLEVCKSLGIDKEFITLANEIRKGLDNVPGMLLSTKKSRYNNRIYVDQCSLCHTSLNLQTHHIQEQSKADEREYIDHYHKNSSFNLLVLCATCHQKIHATGNQIQTVQTLEGNYVTAHQ